MGETTKADATKQPQQQHQSTQPIISSSPSPKESHDHQETPPPRLHHLHLHHRQPFISSPVYISTAAAASGSPSSPFETAASAVNPKRPRYGSSSNAPPVQWKTLPSPSSSSSDQPNQTHMVIFNADTSANPISSPPSTSANPIQPQLPSSTGPGSSSETAGSSPSLSPLPSSFTGQEPTTNKPETESLPQFRKGKYVSPVWKPNEMLWLARAWRVQYQHISGWASGSGGGGENLEPGQPGRGKTRAEKDREVADFLNRHGINRDSKTAGTKWDNMLGEFRKVYEWERGGDRERFGKSYFRLSPYERKQNRLPASFDEEVFEELAQFMGPRMRAPTVRGVEGVAAPTKPPMILPSDLDVVRRPLPPPPPLPTIRDDDIPNIPSGRTKPPALATIGDDHPQLLQYFHSTRGTAMFSASSSSLYDPSLESIQHHCSPSSTTTTCKDLRRIGKIRMTWEESVNLWAEEGDIQRGRIRVSGSSFLNAEELLFFDDSMVACSMEAFEDGPLKGFSVDRFLSGQQVKVFGRRKSTSTSSALSSSASAGLLERGQPPFSSEPFIRSIIPTWEFQDPSEHYLSCLRVSSATLPSLFELSCHLQEPPPEDLRFPLRKDVHRDLPPGKELFFTTSSAEPLDCRAVTYDIVSSILARSSNPNFVISSKDSLIPLWDDCVNRVVSKFCPSEMAILRKPSSPSHHESVQDQWPNVLGFVKGFGLWRGEETDRAKESEADPSSLLVEKLLWSYSDLPYILGYHAVGFTVTFCALSRSQDGIICTDLYSFDASSPSARIKALVPCYRLACLLPLLADRCIGGSGPGLDHNNKQFCYSDFERIDHGDHITEMTPNSVTKLYTSKRKWTTVKQIYDFLEYRVPHAEHLHRASERDLSLTFKPRGVKVKPRNIDHLVEALMCVTEALVALHDVSFMHRDLGWDKVVMRKIVDQSKTNEPAETEWLLCGFEEACDAPHLNPHTTAAVSEERGRYAPEMGRGLHGVKVDAWGVGYMIKTCGLSIVPKILRDLQNKCLEPNPEQRPTAADCYHHLLQVQSAGTPLY